MAFAEILDLVERAKARVLSQYRQPKFLGLVGALVDGVQLAEAAVWDLIAQTSVDTATGAWLTRLGELVGQGRNTSIDVDYRIGIKARIQANRSVGDVEGILQTIRTLYGGTLPDLNTVERYPAGYEVTLNEPRIPSDCEATRRFIAASRSAGVGVMFLYQYDDDANTFTFASGSALEASADQGFENAGVGGTFRGAERA